MKKAYFVVVIVLIALIGTGVYVWSVNQATAPEPTPSPSGQTTDQPAVNHPLINVSNPIVNQLVSSPLTISGEARGTWYFEATFPVQLFDATGKKIAEGSATAQDDWMTTEFVPFTVTLSFSKPSTPTGKLVLHKSNPSDLPENDDQIEIPVKF